MSKDEKSFNRDTRLLNQAQREELWGKLKESWQVEEGHYWYPLKGLLKEPLTDIVYFEADWFRTKISQNMLAELLKAHGADHVLGIWENGVAWEADADLIDLWYRGLESYWTSENRDWLIYISHENSITVAGKLLLDSIKKAWPEWETYMWGDYDGDSPEGQNRYSPPSMFPGTF